MPIDDLLLVYMKQRPATEGLGCRSFDPTMLKCHRTERDPTRLPWDARHLAIQLNSVGGLTMPFGSPRGLLSIFVLAGLALSAPAFAQIYPSDNVVLLSHRDEFSSYSDIW